METGTLPEAEGAPLAAPGLLAEGELALAEPPVAAAFDTGKAARYSVASVGANVVYSMFNFAMPFYLGGYGLPPPLVGLLANERSFVGALVQPVVGRLSDRARTPLGRRRPFFLFGIPLMSVALLVLALHPDFWVMLAVMSVAAFFLAIAWDPYMALLADLFTPEQRGRAGGLVGLGAGVGTILLLLIALQLWEHNEFLVFVLVVIILLATWGYTFFTVREPPLPAETARPEPTRPKRGAMAYLRDLLNHPEAAKYTLAVNFYWLGTGGVTPFITPFGTHALGATESEAFILPIAATVIQAISAVPVGYLADRFTKKRVMIAGLALLGAAGLVGSQSATLWQAAIALSIIGLANASMAQVNPMLSDLVPRPRVAEFIGLGSAVFSFAQPLGSVLAGAVVGVAMLFVGENDAYRWAFIFAAAMVLLSALLLRTVHPERVVHD